MQNPNNLEVYQQAKLFAMSCASSIKLIASPRIREQLIGSTTSVPANLAEFCSMDSKGAKLQKLKICIGETNETDFWLEYCANAKLMPPSYVDELIERNIAVRKQLIRLKQKIAKE